MTVKQLTITCTQGISISLSVLYFGGTYSNPLMIMGSCTRQCHIQQM